MKAIAVNGSPRRDKNTAILLEHALEGAKSQGAQVELIHLYQLNFKGCISCFACKRKGNDCDGVCYVKDELRDVLERIRNCDVLVLGAPIYFGNITGEMRSFMERLLFPNISYNTGERSVFEGKIDTAFIYTMNVTKEQMKQMGYEFIFKQNQSYLQLFHGKVEELICYDTYQFRDYSLYEACRYDEPHKKKVQREQFPIDCENAFEMGKRLASR